MSVFSLNPAKPGLLDQTGKPFFTLGVNYEGYFDRAWAMWRPDLYDAALIEKDFAKARRSGFNTLRLFVQKENRTEVLRGDWRRFDTVFGLAEKYGLAVMLAFNDEHSPHLEQVGAFNAKIVKHFKDNPVIHSWDIENEPRLYNLLVATYPNGRCPLLTSALVDHYGEFASRSQIDLSKIPAALRRDPTKAFYYRNAVLAYTKFSRQAVQSGLPSTVDYMRSPQAAQWGPFLELLDETVAAWLAPQLQPMKAADPNRLFSVGWNWENLAALPANRALDFHQIHKYGKVGYTTLHKTFSMLKALQRTFPSQPVIMGEYGYSTDESRDPAARRPVDPRIAALHEAALTCFLRADGFAGGLKWMLNDVRDAPNPFEAGLGVFADAEKEKPSRRVFSHLASIWRSTQDPGQLQVMPDSRTRIRFDYQCERGSLFGGGSSGDVVRRQTGAPAHIFVTHSITGELRVEADAGLTIQFKPNDLSSQWQPQAEAAVYRLKADTFSPEGVFPAGQALSLALTDDQPRLITPLSQIV